MRPFEAGRKRSCSTAFDHLSQRITKVTIHSYHWWRGDQGNLES